MDEANSVIFELHQGLRVMLQADTPRGHFTSNGEVTYVSNHHFRVSCDTRVPSNLLKPNHEIRMYIEGKTGTSPIVAKYIRPMDEGSHVLILSLPSGSIYRNRRAFFRGDVNAAVALKQKNGNIIHGEAKNISGGGLLISVEESLQKNEELEVDVLFSESEVISAKVRVMRIEKYEDHVDYGVKFLEIRRRDQDRICRMVIVREFEARRTEIKELNENTPVRS